MPRTNRIASTIASLAGLTFNPISTRPIQVHRVVRTEKCIVAVDLLGNIYTTQATGVTYWRTDRQFRDTLECLIKLRMLSASAVEEHRAARAADEVASQRRWAARSALESLELLGVALNKTQRAALDNAAQKEVQA